MRSRLKVLTTALSAAAVLLVGLSPSAAVARPASSPGVVELPGTTSARASAATPGPDLERLCARLEHTPARTPLCSHGPDSLAVVGDVSDPTTSTAPVETGSLCQDGGIAGKRIEVLYGVPSDRANRYSQVLPTMRQVLAEADANLDASDAATSQHYRFLCENGTDVTVRNVTLLPVGADGSYTFNDYVNSLQYQVENGLGPRNFTQNDRIYMTFVDQITDVYPYAGQGSVYGDDSADPNVNVNNNWYARYSMTAYFSAHVVGHEIGHNIGGIQLSAPHSSGGYHCHDENDIMCYSDGGSYFRNGGQLTTPCPDTGHDWLMDCGKDDYYYPGEPPATSYLATHWNTADSGFLTPLGTSTPTDTTAPTVSTRSPAAGSTEQSQTTNLTATFSEDVKGVSASSFTVKSASGSAVSASVTYDATARRATLDPSGNLLADTRYTATLTGGSTAIRDAAGNALGTTSWTFTTGPAPTVTGRSPGSGATAVNAAANVTATFSEAVQGVSGSSFTLKSSSGAAVPAGVSYDAATRTATLNPSSGLAADTMYTATLTGGGSAIRDGAGNPLAATSWTFLTGPAPTVTGRSPAPGAIAVGRTADVTATFSEAIEGYSTSTVTLQAGSNAPVSATVRYDATTRRVTLDPSVTLGANTLYTVRLEGGTSALRDLAGNPLTTTSWTFTTGLL